MRSLAVVSLALLASPAIAQDGFYMGFGLGSFDYQDNAIVRVLSTNIPRGGAIDDSALSLKLYGGYELNENFAVEVSYGKIDSLVGEGFGFDPPPLPGLFIYSITADLNPFSARAVGQLPLDRSMFFASLGWFRLDGDVVFRTIQGSGPAGGLRSLDESGLIATLGVEWRLGGAESKYRVRLEYESWDIDDADASSISAGLSYRF